MFNTIIAMLHNLKTNRWHPIVFREAPLPSSDGEGETLVRHKSKGHHTVGFDTRQEAVTEAEGMILNWARENSAGKPRLCLERDFPWDGEDVPAMVVFFGESEGHLVPMF